MRSDELRHLVKHGEVSRLAERWRLDGFRRQQGKIAIRWEAASRVPSSCFGRDGGETVAPKLLYGWIPVHKSITATATPTKQTRDHR